MSSWKVYVLWRFILVAFHVTISEVCCNTSNTEWSYSNISAWGDNWSECIAGRQQSPVDITEIQAVTLKEPSKLYFDSYNSAVDVVLVNNGKTVRVSPLSGYNRTVTLKGRGIFVLGNFSLAQTHFHWGVSATAGSEHMIGGKRSSMEVHLVHYNLKYPDFEIAKGEHDGILVLAVLVEASKDASFNSIWRNITDQLDFLHKPGAKHKLKDLYFKHFLPGNIRDFYVYQGSFTTPPCSQTVSWVVFREKMLIPEEYLRKFIDMRIIVHKTEESISNIRPVQPLNSRTVLKTFNSSESQELDYFMFEKVVDDTKVISFLQLHQCHLPPSISLIVMIPSQDISWKSANLSSDLVNRVPLDVHFSYGVTLEMHYHRKGVFENSAHITVKLTDSPEHKSVDIVKEYFKLDKDCLPASCAWSTPGKSRTCSWRMINTDEVLSFTLSLRDACNQSHELVIRNQNTVIFSRTMSPSTRAHLLPVTVDPVLNASLSKWYFILVVEQTSSAANAKLFLDNPSSTLNQRILVIEGNYYNEPRCSRSDRVSDHVKLIVGVAVGIFILAMVLLTFGLLWRRYKNTSKPSLLERETEQDTAV